MTPETNTSILAEAELNLVQASTGKRFANYIIDIIVFYIVMFIFGIILGIIYPAAIETLDYDQSDLGKRILDRLITLFIYGIYMFVVEALFKGKSVGKMITGTRAVNDYDGSNISVYTALTRGLSRAVPFEAFSAFGGYPWHDKWTNTYVIDEKQSVRVQQ